MIVDEYGASENSTYVTNLIVYDFNIYMETTGGDVSWINKKNERNNIIIHNMVRSGLIDSNKHEKNGAVQQRHNKKYIEETSTLN